MSAQTYEYKMVQLPRTFVLKQDTGNEIAIYLQQLATQHAHHGWEFHRIDSVGVAVSPGCLAAFAGAKQTMTYYNIATFRRPTITE